MSVIQTVSARITALNPPSANALFHSPVPSMTPTIPLASAVAIPINANARTTASPAKTISVLRTSRDRPANGEPLTAL
jgi:hypothetical protein